MRNLPTWDLALDCRNELGEGPSWDEASATLLWVDITGRLVQRFDPVSASTTTRPLDTMPGAVVSRQAGGLALALEDGVWLADEDDGPLRRLAPIEPDDQTTRLNDAKCDRKGRLWAGTMAFDTRPGAGSLYRVEPGGHVDRVLAGLAISNGMAWSHDDRLMYFIDSATGRIDVLDFDPADGRATNRRPFIEIPARAGWPDGMTIDANGALWVALWDGHAVRRYTPSGDLDWIVELPVARVSSCTFGGPSLTDLYVTTARDGLSADQLATQPLAGGLFVVRPGVGGLPAFRFAG